MHEMGTCLFLLPSSKGGKTGRCPKNPTYIPLSNSRRGLYPELRKDAANREIDSFVQLSGKLSASESIKQKSTLHETAQ